MRTIYRDNYTPQLGDYHDRLIIDGAQDKKWLFDCDGVYTEMDGAEVVNEKGDSTTKAISQKLFTDETNSLAQDITDEANTRSEADRAIWEEIEEIEAASDVTDVVGTHADLEAYDTSKLKDNDIIKVLEDETQDDQITYYRWDKDTSTFSLIGAVGPYYTKTEADNKFQDKLTAGANVAIDADNVISATDTTYTAGANVSIDSDNVISATDTTYSNFVGTDGVDPGVAGLVPAPATTDTGKFLSADGTWAIAAPTLYNTYGQNTDAAMTQKATTDLVYTAGDPRHINIGSNSFTGGTDTIFIGCEDSGTIGSGNNLILIGHDASSGTGGAWVGTGSDAVGIGHGVFASNESVAIGHNARTNNYGTAVGSGATAGSQGSTAIGRGVTTGQNGIAIGASSSTSASGQYAVAIGHCQVATKGVGVCANMDGYAVKSVAECSVDVGWNDVTGKYAVGVGYGGKATGLRSTAIGSYANALADYAVGVGGNASYTYSVGLGYASKARDQGVVDVSTGTTTNGYQGANDQTRTSLRVISGVHDGELATDAATVSQAVGTTETYTIADTDWVALTGVEPYTYGAVVTAATTIGANTICELFNDDAVTFATYGFAIGAVNAPTVAIYSVGAPTSSVTLKINYKG